MILARQAEWQRSRARQTWADKLRIAVLMREDLKSFRKSRSEKIQGRTVAEMCEHRQPDHLGLTHGTYDRRYGVFRVDVTGEYY